MSATKTPDSAVLTTAPVSMKEWTPDDGETESQEWPVEEKGDMLAHYETIKAAGSYGGKEVASLRYANRLGRASLVASFTKTNSLGVRGSTITMTEELYAVDVDKDISAAPYFLTGGTGVLTDDQVGFVRLCSERHYSESEITDEATERGAVATLGWANWTTGMKQLRYHYEHGVEVYHETGFVFRRSLTGVRTSYVKTTFDGVNEIVTGKIRFQTDMFNLIRKLPAGEWLKRPPAVERLGRGRWRVYEEYQWATKWSIVYGGTWGWSA